MAPSNYLYTIEKITGCLILNQSPRNLINNEVTSNSAIWDLVGWGSFFLKWKYITVQCACSKMSSKGIFIKITDFLKSESFPKSCRWKKIRNNNWNFSKQNLGDYDDALLIYGVPKFMTVYAFRRNHLWQFFFFYFIFMHRRMLANYFDVRHKNACAN